MAIQLLKSAFLCSVLLLFAGCEKWADGVVREIEFPEHEPEIAATVVLTSGDTEAVACLYQSVSNLTDQQSNIPSGVSARILKDGVEVLSWAPGDTGWIGQEWDKRMMHVIGLDAPLDLPQGAYRAGGDGTRTRRAHGNGCPASKAHSGRHLFSRC